MGLDELSNQTSTAPGAPGLLGKIIAVNGSRATLGILPAAMGAENTRTTVSKFVMIHGGTAQLIGVVTQISLNLPPVAKELGYRAVAELNLMGEIRIGEDDAGRFRRGISEYPTIGDLATLLSSSELRLIHNKSSTATGTIGKLLQDCSIEANINVNDMLSKHFAVLGTTGVGKSSAVMILLQQVLNVRPDVRIFLLDAHNEYGKCFGEQSMVLNLRNLKLPFWLFNFEEIVDVFFGGRPGNADEVAVLAELIPLAKVAYLRQRGGSDRSSLKRSDTAGYTAHTPVPYTLSDLVALIDERMGKLENRSTRTIYHKLISRIETVRSDLRYAFMFENANFGGDTFSEVLNQLFRLIPAGRPMTVMHMAGFPAEVIDAVVSVVGRLAFEFGFWSKGAAPVLFVCEEAHRYASSDRSTGFGPTRRALSRIAKEGRKYGVFLGVVSQRPAELDPTILAQCSTLFVMRMANDRDHAILRSAVSDAASNLLDFIPSLGTGEAFIFGEGVALPTQLRFARLHEQMRPRNDVLADRRVAPSTVDLDFIASVVKRWRGTMASNRFRPEAFPCESQTAAELTIPISASPGLSSGIDIERFSILKKPITVR
jgi:uncharacterized protein